MNDSIETLIKEITAVHGVVLGRDDPLLILETMNARLMSDNAKAQEAMLHQYKEELESIALRWEHDTTEKSERILNATLDASQKTMTTVLQNSAKNTVLAIKNEVDDKLSQANYALRHAEKIATMNICASGITLLAVCLFVIGLIFN
jgi:hypothetical protein